jgi:hypothetical protein
LSGKHVTNRQVGRNMRSCKEGYTQAAAAARSGFSERTGRRIGTDPVLPSQRDRTGRYRTRQDPFAEVWREELVPMLQGMAEPARDDAAGRAAAAPSGPLPRSASGLAPASGGALAGDRGPATIRRRGLSHTDEIPARPPPWLSLPHGAPRLTAVERDRSHPYRHLVAVRIARSDGLISRKRGRPATELWVQCSTRRCWLLCASATGFWSD